ncbi:hypothetical protein KY290_021839 [Solanum tuberosum]|uniref:Zinc finger PMZ-type domain-containing protein n=1 Tax=Solanum tuberosum TaxID=4113 RepID=A0ABQ7V4Q2_SOLTU|nr:hypothetical protein KY289_021003 [Solanum tuberosum]KAH0758346.1 hypothetical protein KY290_021839 [Solanum tuberosum]
MEDHIIIGVDLHGEWVENPTRYTWRSKGRETVPIKISENVTYDELVNIIVSRFELDCDKNDLSISYMLGFIEKQKGAHSRIRNDLNLRFFLDDQSRPILRISVVEKIIETTNSVVNDEEHPVTMDIPINEEASLHPISTQGSRYTDDDGTYFYKGKIFKDKQELTKLLKLASVKKDQRFKSVKSSKDVYCARCVDQNCDWWLRATKLKSCNRFEITKYRNIHSCGAQHLTSHHPHASVDVIAEYIQPNYLNGKGPSTKDIKNIVEADLGCKISYWKCWKSSEIAKAMIRGTPEHGYAVLDGYRHMIMTINEGSKTSLKLDDKGRHPSIEKTLSKFYSEAYHGCCTRHLGENARKNFHCGAFLGHYYHATKAYRRDVFHDHFEQIRIINAEVADYLENVGFHKCSRAYFPGNRYDVLTSNIVESVNAMFNEAREFPIIALFNDISKRWSEKSDERRMAYAKLKITFVPSTETKIMANKSLGNKLLVHQIDEDTFSVTADNGIAMVHLRSKICSCREFDLDKIPCQLAMAALRYKFGDEYGKMIYEYSSPYYKVESYILAYADPIYPVPAEEFWNLPLEILERVIPPPEKKTKLGRKRLKRVPTIGEVVS